MKKEEKIDPINYIYVPTKKLRIKRLTIGVYIVEKEVAVYNLFGPGLQSSRPIDYFWMNLLDKDITELEINVDKTFELK